MPRKKFPTSLVELIYRRDDGRCHHCGRALPWNREKPRLFDLDHFPIPYRDVEDQVCCGVTDSLDPQNLVLSCRHCNRSHTHEDGGSWCGHAQFPCKRVYFTRAYMCVGVMLLCMVSFWIGHLVR